MGVVSTVPAVRDVYITDELDRRAAPQADLRLENRALQELARRMVDDPEGVLPAFVDLAMEIAGGISAGVSLFEAGPGAGVFRWRYLRGTLAAFENALTPRDFSPCGVTLDEAAPVLVTHPERVYGWISDAGIVVPEVLLVPLYLGGESPLGTLWIVSADKGHFHRTHAQSLTDLAKFLSVALRMLQTEHQLEEALAGQALLTKEMSHRVKNLFAVTDGMIRLSARSAATPQDMAEILSGRLHALASAHSLVSHHLHEVGYRPRASSLHAVLSAVLAPYETAASVSPRVVLAGPDVPCGDRSINGLALVFHELATNAVKYGALSAPQGQISIDWRTESLALVVTWTETGGPLTEPSAHQGFGGSLIQKTITGQFTGEADYTWRATGLRAVFRLPLERLAE